jgi:hypothetical protein
VDTVASMIADNFEMSVRGFVYAEEESVRRFEIHYPSSWWQHFKQRFFFKRMLRKWPVKETVHRVDVEAIYPEFRPKLKGHAAKLVVINQGAEVQE